MWHVVVTFLPIIQRTIKINTVFMLNIIRLYIILYVLHSKYSVVNIVFQKYVDLGV